MSAPAKPKPSKQSLRPCSACHGTGFERDEVEFGRKMQARRVAGGATLSSMAEQMNLSIGYVCDLEHGRKKWRSGLIIAYEDALSLLIGHENLDT